MKVSRVSGLPIENTDHIKWKAALSEGMEAVKKEFGNDFTKLSQTEKGKFMRKFEEMREEVNAQFEFEVDLDIDTVFSKTQLKKLINRYGVIAFGPNSDGELQCFILDSPVGGNSDGLAKE